MCTVYSRAKDSSKIKTNFNILCNSLKTYLEETRNGTRWNFLKQRMSALSFKEFVNILEKR